MTVACELDDAVGQIAALLAADTNPDTYITGWADEAWRVKAIITDDLVVPKEYPVIYVAATGQERRALWADTEYETRLDVNVIVEQQWREPTPTTDSKRQLTLLCRRVEEVLRVNRVSEPYWSRSVFHDEKEALRLDLYRLEAAQHVIVGGVLYWFGYRVTQLA
jgi:hypothetical protein